MPAHSKAPQPYLLPAHSSSAAQAGLKSGVFYHWDVPLVPNPAGMDVSREATTTSQAQE